MKKKDIILVISLLIVAGVIFGGNKLFNSKRGDMVEIYVNNKLYKEVSIDKEQKIEIINKKAKNVLLIHNKGVEMIEANCPDKVCVNTGFISKPGESIVCLPHRVNVKIVSMDKSKKDHDVIVK